MCKYCDIDKKRIQKLSDGYYSCTFAEADNYLVDGKYEACGVAIYGNRYVLRLVGNDETFSEPISYCPFCGKKLKLE